MKTLPPLLAKRRAPRERRAAVLAAAHRVLRTQDYHDITMDDVARRAGVAKGSLYLHFPHKEALFRGVVMDLHERVRAAWGAAGDHAAPGAPRVRELVRVQLEFFEENQRLFLQVFQGTLPGFCGTGRDRSRVFRAQVERMAEAIGEGVARGHFRRVDPVQAAIGLLGLVRGFAVARILGGFPGPLTRQLDDLWSLFTRGVRA